MMSSKHEPPCLDSRRIYLMKVDQSLEETMSKMVNLVTLYISLQTDCALEHFKFYRPALNGLRFCQNLKEFILHFDGRVNDDPDWEEDPPGYARFIDFDNQEETNGETMLNFMDMVATNCPNITKLEIKGWKNGLELEGLTWIPRLTNLEELSFTSGDFLKRQQNHLDMFYNNPMAKLKHLKFNSRGTLIFDQAEFLMKLHTTFPALESFTYEGTLTYEGQGIWRTVWTLETIVGVLESLGNVKNLKISNVMIVLKKSPVQEKSLMDIFAKVVNVIKEKFPKNSTQFLIREDESKSVITKEEGKLPWISSCNQNIRERFPQEENMDDKVVQAAKRFKKR